MTFITNVVTTPSEFQLDTLGRLNASNPSTILDSSHIININDFQETQTITGAGTISLNAIAPLIDLTLTGTGTLIRQTRERATYNTSNSLSLYMTGVLNAGSNAANITSRIGYFDTDDGIYFECKGSGDLYVVVRSSGTGAIVNNSIPRVSWNVDKLDGTGISGENIDVTKVQLYFIDFAWIGIGYIRVGIIVDGKYCCCHKFVYKNILTQPFMTSPNHPIRYEISSTGGATGSLKKISSMAIGNELTISNNYSINMGVTYKTIATTRRSIIAVRILASSPKSVIKINNVFVVTAGTTKRDTIASIDIIKDTNATAVIPGAAWVAASGNVEYDITSTTYTPNSAVLYTNTNSTAISSLMSFAEMKSNDILTTNLAGLSDLFIVSGTTATGNGTVNVIINYTQIN